MAPDPEDRTPLVDPAAYGGHREVDLAMLQLFGSPSAAFGSFLGFRLF